VVPAEPAPIPAPIEAPAPAAPSPATSARATRPQASTTAPDLEAEVSLLAAAQSAIARGDYATALATLDEHRREFPRGALSEERTAARAVALCGAGRQIDGKALASSFLTRHPSSPLAPRVRSSCGVP
jgi:outer membrane protein assembly factor BamD (BamD/ComL family)